MYLLEYCLEQVAGLLNHELSIVFLLKEVFEEILFSTDVQSLMMFDVE